MNHVDFSYEEDNEVLRNYYVMDYPMYGCQEMAYEMINPNTKVVPIDHGWANMKTEQDVFTSGVSEITTEPALFNDVLEYNNKYYKIGGKRLEVKEDKVHDDNYSLVFLWLQK